ncbi:MAG TPA: glycosyltransferase family 2 protein [Steroidobacteraceae bacterium]|nr:glycosyltransferase family 2 protein [Steroidobacteraceae bacterium]
MTLALLVIASLCLLLAAHPFVTYPCSLILLRAVREWRPASAGRVEPQPTFAICMCAYNEEAVIEAKLRNLLALRQRHPQLQLLVYVDASTDATAAILERHRGQIELHVSPRRQGKTFGMNLLASLATADVLIFTDANVMLDRDCVSDLARYFRDPEVGCVCGNLTYTNADASVTAATGAGYWRFEQTVKRLETETGSTLMADGSIFAVRRHLHRVAPDDIIDDMYVSLIVLIEGYRIVQAQDVRAYEASATDAKEEFGRKVRIACQAFNVHRLLWPWLRRLDALTRYKYVSHKLLRWLSIYFLGVAICALIGALISAGHTFLALLAIALLLAGAALGYWTSLPPFAQIVDLLLALAATGIGVWRSLRGDRFQTWTPASSVRRA